MKYKTDNQLVKRGGTSEINKSILNKKTMIQEKYFTKYYSEIQSYVIPIKKIYGVEAQNASHRWTYRQI